MSEKCFCHLNGYAVKDSTARAEIAALKAAGHVDSEARSAAANASSAAAAVQEELTQHKAAEVVDTTARSSILSLQTSLNEHKAAEVVDTTARSTAGEAKNAAATNTNSIAGHETRIAALETKPSGGVTRRKVTVTELQALMTEENIGKIVEVQFDTANRSNQINATYCWITGLYTIQKARVDGSTPEICIYKCFTKFDTFSNANTLKNVEFWVKANNITLKETPITFNGSAFTLGSATTFDVNDYSHLFYIHE